MIWFVSLKEVLLKFEVRVFVKDVVFLGWWDECVDEKLWLRRFFILDFLVEMLGLEEE